MMQPCACIVIIPAHNEGRVIGRLLQSLVDPNLQGTRIVVAANGCTDDTVARANAFADRGSLQVIDTPIASKTAALNAADGQVSGFPRVYIDADVVVTHRALREVCTALMSDSDILVARPPIQYDTVDADHVVRAFYRARARTPSLMSSMWGAGFYGVSERGRARWKTFPNDLADDLFVDGLFTPTEKHIVDTDPVIVTTPLTTRALLHTLRRVYRATGSPSSTNRHRSSWKTLGQVLSSNARHPRHLHDAGMYVMVALLARVYRSSSRSQSVWERDETSR